MDNTIVKRQNFEVAKKDIKRLLANVSDVPTLKTFEVDGGWLGWADHRVTGAEMNEYSTTLSKTFNDQYKNVKELYKVAGKIWDALDALDEGHLKGIYASLKVGDENLEKIKLAQEDIRKSFTILKGTVGKLEEFTSSFSQKIESVKNSIVNSNVVLQTNRIEKLEKDVKRFELLVLDIEKNNAALGNSINEVEKQLAKNKAEHENFVSNLRQETELKITALDKTEQQHKSELEASLAELEKSLAEQKAFAESLDSRMVANVENIGQRISELDKSLTEEISTKTATIEENISFLQNSIEAQMEEEKSAFETSIFNLQQKTDSQITALEKAEQQHKSELEATLAEQKAFAESLDTRMSSNVEDIGQRITKIDKSLSEEIATKTATIEENVSFLKHSFETQQKEDKSALETSISNLQQKTDSQITELKRTETKDKEELLIIISEITSELTVANEQNQTKFKWAYCIAGTSLAINIVLIVLRACGII